MTGKCLSNNELTFVKYVIPYELCQRRKSDNLTSPDVRTSRSTLLLILELEEAEA